MKRIIAASAALLVQFCFVAQAQSVQTISGEDIENVPSAHLLQALEGQMLGLGTLETGSELGYADITAYVRGLSTQSGSTPLFVVDGVQMQDYNIDFITAEEIESISLLKDAASTAIYGLRGANGVIYIKTKHGRPGKVTVRTTADFAIQQISAKPLRLSAGQYSDLRTEAFRNSGNAGTLNLGTGDNDWYDRYVRPFATMQRAGVSVSGGSEKIRVWSNINFMNQTSILRQETSQYRTEPRKTWVDFRAKVDVDMTDWITADVQIAGNIQNNLLAGEDSYDSDIYQTIFNLPPTLSDALTPDGNVATVQSVDSPAYGLLNRSGYTKLASAYLSTSAGLKFDLSALLKGLSVSGRLAFQSSNDRYNRSLQDFSRYYYDFSVSDWKQLGSTVNTNLTNSVAGTYQYAVDYIASVDWNRTFDVHSVGARFYSYFTEELADTAEAEYPGAGMPFYTHSMGLQLLYGWNSKIDAGITLGINGSDAFSRENRYTPTPSAYVSWKTTDWLKLRLSGGLASSDRFSTGYLRYLYKDYIKRDGTIVVEGNPSLKPELRKEVNLGADMVLPYGFGLTADGFYRHLDNMLVSMGNSLPSYQGIPSGAKSYVNSGVMSNWGFELSLSWKKNFTDWHIGAVLQWAHTCNRVISAQEAAYPSTFAYAHRIEGYPSGQIFGYLTDGYINTDAELAEYTEKYSELGVPQLGDFKYKDLNGDGIVNQKDLAPIGKGSCPTDFASLRLEGGWRDLEVSLLFSGVAGYYATSDYGTDLNYEGVYCDLHRNAWTAERYAAGEKITSPSLRYGVRTPSSEVNDWNTENRSFLRLKNASVSYRTGSVKWILSAQNLFTVSAMKSKVMDPETGTMTSLPVFRVFNLGVKIDF